MVCSGCCGKGGRVRQTSRGGHDGGGTRNARWGEEGDPRGWERGEEREALRLVFDARPRAGLPGAAMKTEWTAVLMSSPFMVPPLAAAASALVMMTRSACAFAKALGATTFASAAKIHCYTARGTNTAHGTAV